VVAVADGTVETPGTPVAPKSCDERRVPHAQREERRIHRIYSTVDTRMPRGSSTTRHAIGQHRLSYCSNNLETALVELDSSGSAVTRGFLLSLSSLERLRRYLWADGGMCVRFCRSSPMNGRRPTTPRTVAAHRTGRGAGASAITSSWPQGSRMGGRVGIRNSKNPAAGTLALPAIAWATFTGRVR
jgi:hypothetical protein